MFSRSSNVSAATARRVVSFAAALCVLLPAAPAFAAGAPTVAVTAPRDGETLSGSVALAADASGDSDIVQVKWYVDGVQVASDGDGAPWTRDWDSAGIANGQHRVFAKAKDATGAWGTSATVAFTVDNAATPVDAIAPTVSVSAPNGGATVSGPAVPLSADAFDNDVVVRVKWYVDGVEVRSDGDGAPWTRPWDSSAVADGDHRVMAKARDAAGNWGASTSVRFSVHNAPCGRTAAPAAWQHVVWIVFENKSYDQIVGSANAPYLNRIAGECGLAADYHAVAHPSLPNYIAMTSGSTQGITDDGPPSVYPLTAPSIFSQLGTGGWRSLEESMPAPCASGSSGLYAVRHNPAAYYVPPALDCLAQDVPLTDPPDISAPFTFVTPNLCHDMHSSPCASTTADEVAAGDTWLASFLPGVFATPEYRSGSTAVFITWDEDDFTSVQRVPTIVVAPSVAPGTEAATTFDHYGLLRTTEDMLGLDHLGGAATATSMKEAFGL
jgi:hypothetical protein